MTYQASFVGYFPADHPKYSCMVVVYAPSNDVYYGGAVSAPVFKEISDKVYSNRMEMHDTIPVLDSTVKTLPLAKAGSRKDLTKVLSQLQVNVSSQNSDAMWVSSGTANNGIQLTERKVVRGMVPNVIGMGAKDAMYLLENAGLRVKINGKGIVTKQSMEAGSRIQRGQQIVIELI
jgi:cell division protein FtsI (penicillin-binding protein 3)